MHALHVASWKDYDEVVEILLDAGARMNDQNEYRHCGTPPQHAVHGNQKKVAVVLIKRRPDLKAKNLNRCTHRGETTIHNAKVVVELPKM